MALGLQIIGIMLLGALFAIPSALGFIGVFYYSNWKLKVLCGGLGITCLGINASFYSWGWLGHPLAIWRGPGSFMGV